MELALLFGTGMLTVGLGVYSLWNKSGRLAKPLLVYTSMSLLLFVAACVYAASLHKEQVAAAIAGLNVKQIQEKYAGEEEVTAKQLDAPFVRQMPELPRGCEVTSLAMLLGYAGVEADKMTLAEEVKKDPTPRTVKNGTVHYGNPHNGFIGDMYSFTKPGLGVYHGPVYELAEQYLPGRVTDMTGSRFDSLIEKLKDGKPVWVITNVTFNKLPSTLFETWQTPDGPMKITRKEHSVLVTGFDEQFVYFNDPLAETKNSKADKTEFAAAWEQMGSQAISLK